MPIVLHMVKNDHHRPCAFQTWGRKHYRSDLKQAQEASFTLHRAALSLVGCAGADRRRGQSRPASRVYEVTQEQAGVETDQDEGKRSRNHVFLRRCALCSAGYRRGSATPYAQCPGSPGEGYSPGMIYGCPTRRLAHSAGVNSPIWVILAAGKRVKISFRYSKGLIPCKRQLAIRL